MRIHDSQHLFCALVLTTLTFTVCPVSGIKRPADSKCKNIDPVDVDDRWFVENEKNGLDYPFGSKGTDDFELPPAPPQDDKTLKRKKCKKVIGKVRGEIVPLIATIKFNRMNYLTGVFWVETFPAPPDALKFYVDLTMVLTNNSTFTLFYICVGETKEFWFVASPAGTNLTKTEKEEILTHVDKELKLSRRKKDIASEKDEVYLLGVKDCDKKGSKPAGLSDAKVGGVKGDGIPNVGGLGGGGD